MTKKDKVAIIPNGKVGAKINNEKNKIVVLTGLGHSVSQHFASALAKEDFFEIPKEKPFWAEKKASFQNLNSKQKHYLKKR